MKPEFIESEIELFVQRILMHEFYTQNSEYQFLKISPGLEKTEGYDAKIVGLTPFYCQFKTSSYLSTGKNFSKRASFCASKKWPVGPAYAFGLRHPSDKKLHHKPDSWQHNILHSLWKSMPHAVAYVAPTFHTRIGMYAVEPRPSYHCVNCMISTNPPKSHIDIDWVSINGHVQARHPRFHGLISIPPHVSVTSLSHTYFFTNSKDVTFHSEPSVVEGTISFGEFLENNVRKALLENDLDVGRPATQEEISIDTVAGLTGLDQESAINLLDYGGYLLDGASYQHGAFHNFTAVKKRLSFAYGLDAFYGISTYAIAKLRS